MSTSDGSGPHPGRDDGAPSAPDRLHSPAAERNAPVIVAQLQRLLPATGTRQGTLLEIASGTGQHAAAAAAALTGWRWWPSDADARARASVRAWCAGLSQVMQPLALDVEAPRWDGVPPVVDAVFCANLLHIAPWRACAGLMRGAARHLAPQGRLIVYGPFIEDGVPTAPSNLAFDADLRARDPAWGLRRLADVDAEAAAVGLRRCERMPMPANNLLLAFERAVRA
jgi:SAM-dependent methyltransferase